MHSIAFRIGSSITIHWYGIFVAAGFIAAVMVLMYNRKYAGIEPDEIFNLTLYGMISGILGARVFYVVEFWDQFRGNLTEISRIDHGGLVFYGGFICATLTLLIYAKIRKMDILRLLDILAPALAVGHAFGRIGCFMNGCCFGKPSEIFCAIRFPEGSAPALAFPGQSLHPVQLYEAACNIMLAVILAYLLKKLRPGQIAAVYFFSYGVLRFILECFRGDNRDFVMNVFSPAQFIGILVSTSGIFLFFHLRKRPEAELK